MRNLHRRWRGNRHRLKISRFDHAAHKVFFEYESTGKVNDTFTVPPYVQDALSAMYFLRAAPLEVGDRMTMPVTDNGVNYKVQVDVGSAERLKTPFGEASAWKLKEVTGKEMIYVSAANGRTRVEARKP